MNKMVSLIGRLLLAQIYLLAIIIQLAIIMKNPGGYDAYRAYLGEHGLGSLFPPLMILIQLVVGLALFVGFKTKLSAYILAIYSIFVAFVLKLNDPIGFMQYLAIAGGFLTLALNPKTAFSLDNLKK